MGTLWSKEGPRDEEEEATCTSLVLRDLHPHRRTENSLPPSYILGLGML